MSRDQVGIWTRFAEDVERHIELTRKAHYANPSRSRTEALDYIEDRYGIPGLQAHVVPYIDRIGKKGDAEDWKRDLLKAAHYLSHIYFLLVREDVHEPCVEEEKR